MPHTRTTARWALTQWVSANAEAVPTDSELPLVCARLCNADLGLLSESSMQSGFIYFSLPERHVHRASLWKWPEVEGPHVVDWQISHVVRDLQTERAAQLGSEMSGAPPVACKGLMGPKHGTA